MQLQEDRPIVLFDGICNLCNSSVRFVLKHDTREQFLFSSLQSDASKKLLLHLNYKIREMNSILLVDKGQILEKSDAVLKIAAGLAFPWNLASSFRVLPKNLRDGLYDYVAKNRYRWFGKKETCVFTVYTYENRFI